MFLRFNATVESILFSLIKREGLDVKKKKKLFDRLFFKVVIIIIYVRL
jgi:hypothetical protein